MQNLSTKEVNYIRDLLSWELLNAKTCYQYACQEANSPHQKIFFDTANMHQQNYLNLLSYVEGTSCNQGGMVQ